MSTPKGADQPTSADGYSYSRGWRQFSRLALTTGAPVIPIAQWGAQDILPYGSKKLHLFPRKTGRMVAGPPVDLSGYAGQRLRASVVRAATADITAHLTGLLA